MPKWLYYIGNLGGGMRIISAETIAQIMSNSHNPDTIRKLKESDVVTIINGLNEHKRLLKMADKYSVSSLAQILGVTEKTIRDIDAGRTWKHIARD